MLEFAKELQNPYVRVPVSQGVYKGIFFTRRAENRLNQQILQITCIVMCSVPNDKGGIVDLIRALKVKSFSASNIVM
jgi:hypothetical protein